MSDSTWIVPLIAGWVLGQGGTILQNWLKTEREKKAIYSEIAFISSQVDAAVLSCQKAIDCVSQKDSSFRLPQSLSTRCYDAFLPSAYLSFRQEEIRAIKNFYEHVATYNRQVSIGAEDPQALVRMIIQKRNAAIWAKCIGDDVVKMEEWNRSSKMDGEFEREVNNVLQEYHKNDTKRHIRAGR